MIAQSERGAQSVPGPRPHLYWLDGTPSSVILARRMTASFLESLERERPPHCPDAIEDVLVVVGELVSNGVCHAEGSLALALRDAGDCVHIALSDSNPVRPGPPGAGLCGAGTGWSVINALAETVVLTEAEGKTVHAFLPW